MIRPQTGPQPPSPIRPAELFADAANWMGTGRDTARGSRGAWRSLGVSEANARPRISHSPAFTRPLLPDARDRLDRE